MVSVSLSGTLLAMKRTGITESQMNLSRVRYYIMDGLSGINLTKVEYSDLDSEGYMQYDNDGHLMTETVDMALQ